MAKFYVQSGSLKAVIDSRDAERAAMWAIQRAMDQIMLDEETSERDHSFEFGSIQDGYTCSMPNDFVALGPTIRVSEVGFGDEMAMVFETFHAFCEWHQLACAVERLAQLLES